MIKTQALNGPKSGLETRLQKSDIYSLDCFASIYILLPCSVKKII